jgi:hypothetical protein
MAVADSFRYKSAHVLAGRAVGCSLGLSSTLCRVEPRGAGSAEKQHTITLVNQSFDERKIAGLRSDASDKTAKQNEADDHFRLADHPPMNNDNPVA